MLKENSNYSEIIDYVVGLVGSRGISNNCRYLKKPDGEEHSCAITPAW